MKDIISIFCIFEPDGRGEDRTWHWSERSARYCAKKMGPTWKVSEWQSRIEVERELSRLRSLLRTVMERGIDAEVA